MVRYIKTVIIASNNTHKVQEITDIFSTAQWECITLEQRGICSQPEETASTFIGNARIKACAARRAGGGLAVLADDSGLVVDALEGQPGVRSARFAGSGATDEQNNELLLDLLRGVPDDKRSARFVCSLMFLDEDGTELQAQGVLEGRIAQAARGSKGFGYDPLFIVNDFGEGLTLAQIPPTEKNKISHRFRALSQLRSALLRRSVGSGDTF